MDTEYIKEPEDGLVRYSPEVVHIIRKEYNLDKKEDREKAIAIIDEWIKQQDHFVKKDFSKGYIERCIITCKGSLERAKKQIDKMCTTRTLMPKYFQITNIWESELADFFDKADFALLPKLTKDYYRVAVMKAKPNITLKSGYEIVLLYKLVAIVAEYVKSNDCCRGFIVIEDFYDMNIADALTKVNLVELQQYISILTECYGCRLKGLYMVTSSRVIEGFINLLKPMFPEKVGKRINAVSSRKALRDLISDDVLPEDYGGSEKPIKLLHENLLKSLSRESFQEHLKEMNSAKTDESKRRVDKFNEHYMGMPGSFRTLSLD